MTALQANELRGLLASVGRTSLVSAPTGEGALLATVIGVVVTIVANTLFILSAVLLFVDAVLSFICRSTFSREEILITWK
jgi:hypothetical protein